MNAQEEFRQVFGPAVSFDRQIMDSYDHDAGEMPRALMSLVRRRPDMVVLARSREDVARALDLARKYGLPLTPRGQATSGYGGSIPARGGIVLDLCSFNALLRLDVPNSWADVEPGIVWEELSRALAPHGLDNRVCPTSAPSSTVGGWFSMGGMGIGSFAYGSFLDNVLEIDVLAFDGTLHTLSGGDAALFYQTCGALGIVVRLRLACRAAGTPFTPAVSLPDASGVIRFLDLAGRDLPVYSACVQSAGYCELRARAEGKAPPISSGFMVSLALLGAADGGSVAALASGCGGSLLDEAVGRATWADRYYPMRLKKAGPSLLAGESVIPFDGFAGAWEDLRKTLGADGFGLEAHAVRGRRLAVLTYCLDNARDFLYPLRLAKALIPLRVAARHGGGPYASGMWLAALARSLYGKEKYRRALAFKRRTDDGDLLNPGTLEGPRLPFTPFNLSRCLLAGARIAAPVAARLTCANTRLDRRQEDRP
ncbi:MAG: FAD-binding oxidoreductase [Desulfovibrio sp.]|jgi:FAD/FMN-containing dehydrogenase|nr:FAD-binding oxidoreductase [Desulfovibrio sp.]